MMALVSTALVLAWRAGERASLLWSLAAGLVLAAAILTKLFAVESLIPVLWLLYRSGPGWSRRVGLFLAGSIVPVGLEMALVAPVQQWKQVISMHDAAAGAAIPHVTPPLQVLGAFFSVDVGLALLALAGFAAVVLLGAYDEAVFLLLWVGGTVLMLLYFRPLFPHHPAILLSGMATCAGVGISAASKCLGDDRRITGIVAAAAVAYVLLGYRLVHADRHIAVTVPPANGPLVAYINKHTSPNRLIVADDLSLADRADRLVVPPLCDPSNVRMYAGYLNAADLIAATKKYRPQLVLSSAGIYAQEPVYLEWLRKQYIRRRAPEGVVAYFASGR
jgi:hypothetical protein